VQEIIHGAKLKPPEAVDTLKCRVDSLAKPKTDKDEATMTVFLKTSEEAQCNPLSKCKWTYTKTLPEITKMTTEFDPDSAAWLVKFTGTGLRDSATKGEISDLQINKKS